MKRVLSLLIATMMIIGMFAGSFIGVESVSAVDDSEIRDVTMIVARWHWCGYDRYGRPLLNGRDTDYDGVLINENTGRFQADPNFTGTYPTYDAQDGVFFPWQDEGEDLWGNTQYKMPNCMEAIQNPGSGLINSAVNGTADDDWSVLPYLYCEVYLTVKAEGGESQLYDKRYVVMDELGQVWIDPDGRFHDCRFWEPADPSSTYYRSGNIFSGDGSTQWNDCDTNPRMIVDPSGDNNTQGPYIVNPNYNTAELEYPIPNYHERVHYWWYEEETDTKDMIDRVWQLGIADQTDYLRRGAYCADGVHTSQGIVGAQNITGGYYPGKPVIWNTQISDPLTTRWCPNDVNILGNDWDVGLDLMNFNIGEMLIDVDGDGTYSYGEPIFSDTNGNGVFDDLDLRLISWTIVWGGQSFNFRKGTLVGLTDEDYQWQLANLATQPVIDLSTLANVKHSATGGVSFYDQVYLDNDANNLVTAYDERLTHINGRVTGMGATSGGYFMDDAFIMLETLKTSCSYKYNIHVESDLWQIMQEDTYEYVEMYPSMTGAQFTSPNGDIVAMSQLVNKATALDTDGSTFYMPATTFFNVALKYREYIGLQMYLDNGIDNNRAEGGECYQLSLADDHVNYQAGELFVGCQDVETAMDYDLILTEFNSEYLYFETSYSGWPAPPAGPQLDMFKYGCGEPFYRDIKKLPLNLGAPLDPDPYSGTFNPGVVNEGDQRMIDMEIYSEPVTPGGVGTMIKYPAGSFVTQGDLDVGRVICMMDPGLTFYDEPTGCEQPNGMYNVGELIYWDPALAAGVRATQMWAWDNVGVHGFGTEDFNPTVFNDPNTGLPVQRWSNDRHGGNVESVYNNGANNTGAGAFGQSGYMDGTSMFDPVAEATVPGGGMDWFFQQNGGISTQYPSSGSPRVFNAAPHNSSGGFFNWFWMYWYDYGYNYYDRCGDLLALSSETFLGDWRLRLWEDTYSYPYTGSSGWVGWQVRHGIFGYWYQSFRTYYRTYYSSALVWYRGQDSQGTGNRPCVDPVTWTNYAFNYDVACRDDRNSTSYEKRVGMGCVYMDDAGSGYGQMYYYSGWNRSFYGWHAGGDTSAMHFLRWEGATHPDNGGRYSRANHLGRFNAGSSGDLLTNDTVHEVNTTVFAGYWTVETEFWPNTIEIALPVGTYNSFGSAGFNHGQYYNYSNTTYAVDAYFSNAQAYHIDVIPSAGDRRRLLAGGHHVGMNDYVYRLEGANSGEGEEEYSTSSTAASALRPFSYFYPCGTKLAAGELYDVKSKVHMVSMGKCGDPRFMDIPVLPGEVDLKVSIDGVPQDPGAEWHLKVEQTADIQVSVDPPPQPGEKYIVKLNGVFQEGIPARESYTAYIQTREANTFTQFCEGVVDEYALDKDGFASSNLDDTYSTTASPLLPFDFPFYDRIYPAGSTIYVGTNGFIGFDTRYMYYIPNTYYWFSYRTYWWGWGRDYRDWTISPLGTDLDLHVAPRSGQTPNDNLQIYFCQPTATECRIRWQTMDYSATQNGPAEANFSCTLYDDGTIRFSYGDNSEVNPYRTAVVGIAGDLTNSEGHNEYLETFYHGVSANALSYVDDIVISRFTFPADPGRAGGGTVDDNYLIGMNQKTVTSDAIGNAGYKVVEITPENPVEHIQYTPYRGSVQEDGSCDPLRMEVFLERGGVAYPTPVDSILSGVRQERPLDEYNDLYEYNIYDPYWVVRPWTLKQYDGRYLGDHTPLPVVSPSGMLTSSCALDNQYDCYGHFDMMVEPEWIDIGYSDSGRTCISPVDQRFPNLVLKLWDDDNPVDVNDPAGMLFSTVAMQAGVRGKMIANVNAHGAGIKYLCTAQSGQEPFERYVIQVNDDGSYTFWRWYEPGEDRPGAAKGALDPTDWLYSGRYNFGGIYGDTDDRWYYASRQPWTDTDGWLQGISGDGNITTDLDDRDCSFDTGICDVCHLGAGFPSLGDVSEYDLMGRFNNSVNDAEPPFFQGWSGAQFGHIKTYGIPTMVTNWDETSDGGEIYIPLQPKNTSTPLQIRVYLNKTIYDYNSAISGWSFDSSHPSYHPPYFVYDDSPGIDYCGTFTVDVQPADKLNFGEFNMIDHGKQFSLADYTSGNNPLAEMNRPSKQIRHWYNPVCGNYKKDMRAYPGGQSHTARAIGSEREGGFNAYPAINYELYNKLGTEFYPMTDYGFYFTLVSPTSVGAQERNVTSYTDWDQYTFDPDGQIARYTPSLAWRMIETIEFTGPFMYPARYHRPNIIGAGWNGIGYVEQRLASEYEFGGVENVPIRYNTSGYLKIDRRNSKYYEIEYNTNFTNIVSPGFVEDQHSRLGNALPSNRSLERSRALVYQNSNPRIMHSIYGVENSHVFAVDEIIPMQPGNIEIKVTLADGTVKIFQDCCVKPIADGVDVHALGIELDNEDIEERGGVFVGDAVTLNARITEKEKADINGFDEWKNVECNDALVFAWQDRGYFDPQQNTWIGAGDGWVTNPPKNSAVYMQGVQYLPADDFDEDGNVSYESNETEILGSYNIASNTWTGAFIDGRTYHRNDGLYKLPIQPDTVGFDFGGFGPTGDPLPPGYRDHVIGFDETLPVWVVAYKYGDDSNDRSFKPLYDSIPGAAGSMSHEVYLAGTRDFEVFPQEDLNMTYGPEPLTAGMTPELQNPESPLHFSFTDDAGNPVDFTQGVPDGFGNAAVIDRDIEMHCFVDPHPDNDYYYGVGSVLPQYYWTRTDLHNFDGTPIGNTMLFSQPNDPFTPIKFEVVRDASNELTGRYNFLGFVANDQGEFEVYAYTPDRLHRAKVTVKVVQPDVKYSIRNTETDETYDDVDYVMTANDDRLYEITATCWDGQGSLIKGTAKEVSVCSGSGEDTARFTPYVTRPENFNHTYGVNPSPGFYHPGVAGYGIGYDPIRGRQDRKMFLCEERNRFYPFLGIDVTNDGKIDPLHTANSEIHRYTAMKPYMQSYWQLYDTWRYSNWSSPLVHYNTTNWRFDDYSYDTNDSWDVPPNNNRGWGWGAIYNNPYAGGYIFSDFDLDGTLSFADSLSFNENGEVSFFFWADDVVEVGGLIGNNNLSNDGQFADVVGFPDWYDRFDPNYMYYRYVARRSWRGFYFGTMDNTFKMDWEAIPNRNARVEAPVIKLFNPETGEEATTNLLDPESYDATYAVRNHFIARVYPADSRDGKIKAGTKLHLDTYKNWRWEYGNKYEARINGKLTESAVDPKAMETIIYWTPTGTGEHVAGIFLSREYNWNLRANKTEGNDGFIFDQTFALYSVKQMDVTTGLEVVATPYNEILKLGQPDTVSVIVKEAATGYLIEGAEVTFRSEDGAIEMEATTDAIGEARFQNVKPETRSKIIINATIEGRTPGNTVLYVDLDLTPPSIDVDDFEAITNRATLNLTGTVSSGAKLVVSKKDAKVGADGKWQSQVTLKEGENQITLHATGANGVEAAVTISVTLDTKPPGILLPMQADIDAFGLVGDAGDLRLTGRVTPGSKVEITISQGGDTSKVQVTVANDIWRTDKFEVVTGEEFTISVKAVDVAGNEATLPETYFIKRLTVIELGLYNTIPTLNGQPGNPIQPPELDSATNSIMIPLADIEALVSGMSVNPAGTSMTVAIDGKNATCTVGSMNATVNANPFTLSAAPYMVGSKMMVPIGFVQKVLELTGKKVTVKTNKGLITITIEG